MALGSLPAPLIFLMTACSRGSDGEGRGRVLGAGAWWAPLEPGFWVTRKGYPVASPSPLLR